MYKYVFLFIIAFVFSSCHKDAGEGGTSVIKGKIWVQDYNTTQTTLLSEYYGADIEVYIIYGKESNYYNDRIRTSFDGSFEFPYLAKGSYRIFAYSKCNNCDGGIEPILISTEVTKNKSVVDVGNLTIKD